MRCSARQCVHLRPPRGNGLATPVARPHSSQREREVDAGIHAPSTRSLGTASPTDSSARPPIEECTVQEERREFDLHRMFERLVLLCVRLHARLPATRDEVALAHECLPNLSSSSLRSVCVCVCVCLIVRVWVCARVRVFVGDGGGSHRPTRHTQSATHTHTQLHTRTRTHLGVLLFLTRQSPRRFNGGPAYPPRAPRRRFGLCSSRTTPSSKRRRLFLLPEHVVDV